jgi:hypothetical protein
MLGYINDSCEHCKEPCGFIKGRVYLDDLKHCNLQKDSKKWNNYSVHNKVKPMCLLSLNLSTGQNAFNGYKRIITQLCIS